MRYFSFPELCGVCRENQTVINCILLIIVNINMWLKFQALVTNRKAPFVSSKARKSVGGTPAPKVSRIPTRKQSVSKLSSAKTPQSSKKSRRSAGNLKKKTPVSAVKKVMWKV
jgi:hypothetical protein